MIDYTIEDSIAFIKLDINKYNMFSIGTVSELKSLFEKAKNDDQVRGVIITGNDLSFCTGIAIEQMLKELDKSIILPFLGDNDNFLLYLFQYPKPIISIINGHSIGEGLLLQLCTDFVLIENNSKIKIGLPEMNIGLSLSPIMFDIIEFYISRKQIASLLYEGKFINCDFAKTVQLVDQIAAKDDLHAIAKDKIGELLRAGKDQFELSKLSVRDKTIKLMQRHIKTEGTENFLKALVEMK